MELKHLFQHKAPGARTLGTLEPVSLAPISLIRHIDQRGVILAGSDELRVVTPGFCVEYQRKEAYKEWHILC